MPILRVLTGEATLAAIDLKADPRASPSSLPGRLYAILTTPTATAAVAKPVTDSEGGGFFSSLFGGSRQPEAATAGSDASAAPEKLSKRQRIKRSIGSLSQRLGSLGGRFERRPRLGATKVPKK